MYKNKQIKRSYRVNSNYIVYGSNENGEYLKYENGKLICWKKVAMGAMNINAPWGSCYESPKINLGDSPYAFKANTLPTLSCTPVGVNATLEGISSLSNTNFGFTYLWRPATLTTASTTYLHIIAIGVWK